MLPAVIQSRTHMTRMKKHTMKTSIFSFLSAILLAGLLSTNAQAQSIQIGYADPEIIITYMPEYQQIQQQMAIEYRTGQEALQALAEDFRSALIATSASSRFSQRNVVPNAKLNWLRCSRRFRIQQLPRTKNLLFAR